MKVFIILSSIFIVRQVYCTEFDLDASKPSYEELERQNLQLLVEVGQLRRANGDLSIENANCKLSLYEIRKKKQKFAEELDLKAANCSTLAREAVYLTQNIKKLSDDVQHFNSIVDKQLADYINYKNATFKEIVNYCDLKDYSELMSVVKTLYERVCSIKKSNGEWTVIQRRMDGITNFYRPWAEYRAGFGTLSGEFFIGLESLHLLTMCAPQELLIEMEDFDNQKRYAMYDLFEIGSEREKYAMRKLGKYTGNAGDSLSRHKSQKFSTFDRDNDSYSPENCARLRKGAWWYADCHDSNLNGEYGNNNWGEGIIWDKFHGDEYSLKFVEIKIRPKKTIFYID